MERITRNISRSFHRIPKFVNSATEGTFSIPNRIRSSMDTVSGNIGRLVILGEALNASEQFLKGWSTNTTGNAPTKTRGPSSSISLDPNRMELVESSLSLLEDAGALSRHPEVRGLGKDMRRAFNSGDIIVDPKMKGTGMLTFDGQIFLSPEFFPKADASEKTKELATIRMSALFAHEGVHKFFEQRREREPGKLSPPRVQIEVLRMMTRHFGPTSSQARLVDEIVGDSVRGAVYDGFHDATELKRNMIYEPAKN